MKEENKKLHRLIAEQMGEADNAEETWNDFWENVTDHKRVNSIMREILSGALIAEGICSEDEVENHINKMLAATGLPESDDPYPPRLMETLEAIRQSGQTNMLDVPMVARLALEMDEPEVADWINTNRRDYAEIIFHGRPKPENTEENLCVE